MDPKTKVFPGGIKGGWSGYHLEGITDVSPCLAEHLTVLEPQNRRLANSLFSKTWFDGFKGPQNCEMIGRVKGFRHSVYRQHIRSNIYIYILVVMITKGTFFPRSFLSQCCQKKKCWKNNF